jgi:hypothetical protein
MRYPGSLGKAFGVAAIGLNAVGLRQQASGLNNTSKLPLAGARTFPYGKLSALFLGRNSNF